MINILGVKSRRFEIMVSRWLPSLFGAIATSADPLALYRNSTVPALSVRVSAATQRPAAPIFATPGVSAAVRISFGQPLESRAAGADGRLMRREFDDAPRLDSAAPKPERTNKRNYFNALCVEKISRDAVAQKP